MSSLVRDPAIARLVAFGAWAIAALSILGLLEPTSNILDRLALDLGDVHISLLTILKGLVALVALLWLANVLSHFLERRYSSLDALTPSIKVLASKVTKILLITIAILAALSIVGIDLTAFAVFSGAVGVGVGFGLQKVVSNLISGVILLLDRSIKPGDVVGVDDTYGWIKDLNARYVSVVTRDGIEHLIPNEDLITQKVANWSYSNLQVRLKIPVGISYNSDVRKAIDLCLEAAAAVERVIAEPRTVCLVKGFGDSSVDQEIRIWIHDPQNGISNVKSEVLLGVWDRFREHGIEIPFPQRDIHLRSSVAVPMAPPSA
jgi:small-conductance mechanosensitive channel